MARVFLSYASEDRALAERLGHLLVRMGVTVWLQSMLLPGQSIFEALFAEVTSTDVVVVLWSKRSKSRSHVLKAAGYARRKGKLLVARIDDSDPPLGIAAPELLDLREWPQVLTDTEVASKFESAVSSYQSGPPVDISPDTADPFRSIDEHRSVHVGERYTLDDSFGHGEAASSDLSDPFASFESDRIAIQQRSTSQPPVEPSAYTLSAATLGSADSPPSSQSPDPVLLAASAPYACTANGEFTAALVAYVAAWRASAQQKLADLGEPSDRRVEDIAASSWLPGAPVTVRLTSEGAAVAPSEIHFEWSGRENLAAFAVKMDANSARDAVLLRFEVLVAGVLVAFIPMRVAIGTPLKGESINRAQGPAPRSAFASYASHDAEPVTQRLSTLTRWAPGLDIFQDCLDLSPGEAFKPQLARQIAKRDVFLLFWSRQAALSPWVRWEYTTALERKGLSAILPMPLEDPAIAPPPPELADQHQRDRFMLAGYGLAKVREETLRDQSI